MIYGQHTMYTYINLRENRRKLKTTLFEKLGISIEEKICPVTFKENVEEEFLQDLNEDCFSDEETVQFMPSSDMNQSTFDLCIRRNVWEDIKPRIIFYMGREYLKLKPWSMG